MANVAEVSGNDLAQALNWLGQVVYCNQDGTRQAFLCSDVTYVGRFDLDPANRNINDEWVREMKTEIKALHERNEMMTLTAAIDKRSIAAFIEAKMSGEDLGMFKAILLDGQHRWSALKQLRDEQPGTPFKFFLIVYVVDNDEEIKMRLMQLNKRREFTKADAAEVDGRLRFLKVWNQVTLGHENRVCVRRIRNSELLRKVPVIKALMNMSEDQIYQKIHQVAQKHQAAYEASEDRFKRSMAGKVVRATGMYQLVKDDASWIDEFASGSSKTSNNNVIVLD